MRINVGTKSAEANVLLYSVDREFVHKGEKKISEAFPHPDFRINYSINGLSIMTVVCNYSMEDKLYPLLKEIYRTKTEDKALAAASVIFWNGGYTERAVFYDGRDIFEVGEIRELSEEEKEELEKTRFRFRRKLFNQWEQNKVIGPEIKNGMFVGLKIVDRDNWNAYMTVVNEREKKDSPYTPTPLELREIEPLLAWYRLRFLEGDYLSALDDIQDKQQEDEILLALDWGTPEPDGRMHVYVDGDIYEIDMLRWPHNSCYPLYAPFEQFAFWPNIHIKSIVKYGWCIRLDGDNYLYLTEPEESEEKRKGRVCRDWSVYEYLHTHLPLFFPAEWNGEEPDAAGVSDNAVKLIREASKNGTLKKPRWKGVEDADRKF